MKIKSFFVPLIVIAIVAGGVWWFLMPSNLPGRAVAQLGRDHIKDSDPDPEYNSNPPTSGPHSAVWTPSGYYESEKNDRNLIHSLEHGYVIVSYNCKIQQTQSSKFKTQNYSLKLKIQNEVFAHGEEAATESASPSASPAVTGDESCHELRDYLKNLVKNLDAFKIVAVPRTKNDSRIALTAWGWIDKFNTLDKERIEKFIKAFRDRGPEAAKD